jgi:hypothetical protein
MPKIIRKTKTISRINTIIRNNIINNIDSNQIVLSNRRKQSEDNEKIIFSESFLNNAEVSKSIENENTKDNNSLNGRLIIKKFTFKEESRSPVNKTKRNNKDIFDTNKESIISKKVNKNNKKASLMRNNKKTSTFKNMEKSSYDEDYTISDMLSNYSSDHKFLILEDFNSDFAKKIKKNMNKKIKIKKIRYLFDLQKQQYRNSLNELYLQIDKINNQKSNNINYANILENIRKKIKETSHSISNSVILSKIMDSEEEEKNLSVKNIIKFDIKKLKQISSESFEIKSSYDNINKITNGDIIKNNKYKNILKLLIQKYLNNNNFNEEILLKKFEYNKKEVSEKSKENEDYNYYNKKEIKKNQNRNESLFESKTSSNLINNDNSYDYKNEEKIHKHKSTIFAESNNKNSSHRPTINESKRDANSIERKDDKINIKIY